MTEIEEAASFIESSASFAEAGLKGRASRAGSARRTRKRGAAREAWPWRFPAGPGGAP